MSIGLAIFLVGIVGFAIYSQGFRHFLLWTAVAIGVLLVVLYKFELYLGDHPEVEYGNAPVCFWWWNSCKDQPVACEPAPPLRPGKRVDDPLARFPPCGPNRPTNRPTPRLPTGGVPG
jgi:hypothetical protein